MKNQLHFIYASTSGNTEAVVEFIAEQWRENYQAQIELHRAEQTSIELLKDHDLFLLATSTWAHGDTNPFFRPLMSQMKNLDLKGKKAFFVGLGDTRYEPVLFCGGLDQLQQRWEKLGGQTLGTPLKIDGESFHQLSTVVAEWAKTQYESNLI